MLFSERVNLTLRQNNLCHFSNDTDPFDGQCIKVWVTIFLYTLFMRLKNGQKLKKIKNTLKKSLIFICHTDVALISTYFVCCGCNFKWITTMPLKFFRILLTNLQKMLWKILLAPQSETFPFFRDFCLNLLRSKKCIFCMHLWRLVNKIQKSSMCIVVIYVKLQPQRTKSVEMRAKSIWQVKTIDFFNVFFLFFNFCLFFMHMNKIYKIMVTQTFIYCPSNGSVSLEKWHKLFCLRVKFTLSLNNITFNRTKWKPCM